MIRKYVFDGGIIEFEDTKSVKELIQYAFEEFDYYEPIGMDKVTIFQTFHSATSTGWFTTDTSKKCFEEIENPDKLCFAYYFPDVFYFAEGGWGHHMTGLGNHPIISNPVKLKIVFDDFRNTVVINGKYCLNEIVSYLKKHEYVSNKMRLINVSAICIDKNYPLTISLSDSICNQPIIDLDEKVVELYKNTYGESMKHISIIEYNFKITENHI